MALLCISSAALWAGKVAWADRAVTDYTFREYQAEMPYVKRIVFEHWDDKKYGPAYFWAEGAFQPQGYYLLYPTNSPFTTNRIVCGLSKEYEWSYAAEWKNLIYGPREPWAEWGKSVNYSQLRDVLLSAAYLGIPRLPGDFSWRSDTEFVFRNSAWGECTGRIVRSEGGRPLAVEYVPTRRRAPYPKVRVTYFYKTGRAFPPESFQVIREWRNGIEEVRFVLHQLELGEDPGAAEGYHLNTFLTSSDEVQEVHFKSNQVRYIVLPDGTMRPYQYSTPPSPSYPPVRVALGAALLAAVLLPAGLLLFHVCGKNKPKPPKQN